MYNPVLQHIISAKNSVLFSTSQFFFLQKLSEKESTDLRSPSPSAKRSLDEGEPAAAPAAVAAPEQPAAKKLKTCEENAAEVGATETTSTPQVAV